MAYIGMNTLGLSYKETLYETPASFLMMMLNQHVLVNVGDEKMMTLQDLEAIEK